MKKTIKTIILGIFTVLAVTAMPLAFSAPAFAQDSDSNSIVNCVGQGSNLNGDLGGTCEQFDASSSGDKSITDAITLIVNIVSIVVGVVAVIMIIWGGLRYITSGGESSKITSAKNTIIYALIGLVVVALAQFIVHFVLAKASNFANQ